MKRNSVTGIKSMHWSAKALIKFGTLAALLLLLTAFIPPCGSFLAISTAETAVRLFAISTVSGLLFDVIAQRTGIRK